MKIKEERNREHIVHYELVFSYLDEPEAGWSFTCDEHGNVDTDKLNKAARKNFEKCLTGTHGSHSVSKGRIEKFEHYYTNPAVGECDICGEEVVLHGFTNTCECGADYNMSGQLLASRSQWGEETGESVSDILQADSDYHNYHEDY